MERRTLPLGEAGYDMSACNTRQTSLQRLLARAIVRMITLSSRMRLASLRGIVYLRMCIALIGCHRAAACVRDIVIQNIFRNLARHKSAFVGSDAFGSYVGFANASCDAAGVTFVLQGVDGSGMGPTAMTRTGVHIFGPVSGLGRGFDHAILHSRAARKGGPLVQGVLVPRRQVGC